MISIAVMVMICFVLSISCVIVWMLSWRRNHIRRKSAQSIHQCDDISYIEKPRERSHSNHAISDTTSPPKSTESIGDEKSHRGSVYKCSTSTEQLPIEEDAIVKDESRRSQKFVSKPLERIKEESTPARSKRVDTVSVMSSMETLQRNDSKVNVFPADKMEEIDLNPGLNSVINLETI
ncbi:hypothetical protein GCK32_016925 [Trichostrongylus colubriformis]|uniref:Uncharacterized protein n=1 Tax=Trichostrongylus colubriformis TaxID=6319 RepID=A0AAN8IP51_TRICO